MSIGCLPGDFWAGIKNAKNPFRRRMILVITKKRSARLFGKAPQNNRGKKHLSVQKDPGNTVHIEGGNCEEKVYLGKALCVCQGSLVFLGGKAFLFGFVTLITKGS